MRLYGADANRAWGWVATGEQEIKLQRAKESIAEAVQSLEF